MNLTIESLARAVINAPDPQFSEWTIDGDAREAEYAALKAAGKLRSPPVPAPRKQVSK